MRGSAAACMSAPRRQQAPPARPLSSFAAAYLWCVARSGFLCLTSPRIFASGPALARRGQQALTRHFRGLFRRVEGAFFAALMIASRCSRRSCGGSSRRALRQGKRAFLPFLLQPRCFMPPGPLRLFRGHAVALTFLLGFDGNVGGSSKEALPASEYQLHHPLLFASLWILPRCADDPRGPDRPLSNWPRSRATPSSACAGVGGYSRPTCVDAALLCAYSLLIAMVAIA